MFEDCSVQANAEDNLHVDLKDVLAGAEKEQEDKLTSETVGDESCRVMVEDTNVVDDPALVLVEPAVIAPDEAEFKAIDGIAGETLEDESEGHLLLEDTHAQVVAAPIFLEQVVAEDESFMPNED